LSLGFTPPRLGFRPFGPSPSLGRFPTADSSFTMGHVELNELDWDQMLKFGGIALLALIVLARLMMRG
jgi:hypothetical protein